jgi:hypothetical protein
MIDVLGYDEMILKSDQEPSIVALRRGIKEGLRGNIMEEESAVGEHQSNGEVENAIQRTQGHFRTVRLALEARYKRRIRGDHHVLPWMLRYVVGMINKV